MPPSLRVLCLLVAALVAGCRPQLQSVGGVPRGQRFQNIVSLSPSTTEIAGMYGPYGMLKGRTAADNFPTTVSRIPVIASVKPDYEKLRLLQPDLVVYDAALFNSQDLEKIKALGAQTFPFDGDTIDAFEQSLYRFSNLAGNETAMSGYVDKIEAARAAAAGEPLNPRPKVAVLIAGQGGPPMIAGTRSLQADVVRAAGGEPIGPDTNRFVSANPEMLVSQNPDAIILAAPKDAARAAAAVSSLLNDPRLRTIAAIKNRRIVPLDQDIVLRRGARLDLFIANAHRGLAIVMRRK